MDTTMLKSAATLALVTGILTLIDVNRIASGALMLAVSVLIVTSLPRERE
ncbi:MAG: hypothetical protein QM597_06730 [Aeromicrobium sp.]